MNGLLSVASLILKYLLSAGLTSWIIFKNRTETKIEEITDFCSFIDYNPGTTILIYLLGIFFFLLGLAISLYLYAYNTRKQKRIGDDLSTRFQYKENIAATRMLSYQMQSYFAISLVGFPVAVINYIIETKQDIQLLFQLLNQTPFLLYLFYTTFYLLHVTFWYDPFFFGITKNLIERFCCKVPLAEIHQQKTQLTVSEETDVYFKQMASGWEALAPINTRNGTKIAHRS
ncbi:hypothetical protein M3Y98_00915600 [Aphelenchoides besseyi]|nr:hypothetical protein M3Y98_00915600 [Aphelenchoides besseyi]